MCWHWCSSDNFDEEEFNILRDTEFITFPFQEWELWNEIKIYFHTTSHDHKFGHRWMTVDFLFWAQVGKVEITN